jgi:hypothetical protein
MNFIQYVGDDKWCVIHKPKSARAEPKSRIRKILPGGKDDKPNGKSKKMVLILMIYIVMHKNYVN